MNNQFVWRTDDAELSAPPGMVYPGRLTYQADPHSCPYGIESVQCNGCIQEDYRGWYPTDAQVINHLDWRQTFSAMKLLSFIIRSGYRMFNFSATAIDKKTLTVVSNTSDSITVSEDIDLVQWYLTDDIPPVPKNGRFQIHDVIGIVDGDYNGRLYLIIGVNYDTKTFEIYGGGLPDLEVATEIEVHRFFTLDELSFYPELWVPVWLNATGGYPATISDDYLAPVCYYDKFTGYDMAGLWGQRKWYNNEGFNFRSGGVHECTYKNDNNDLPDATLQVFQNYHNEVTGYRGYGQYAKIVHMCGGNGGACPYFTTQPTVEAQMDISWYNRLIAGEYLKHLNDSILGESYVMYSGVSVYDLLGHSQIQSAGTLQIRPRFSDTHLSISGGVVRSNCWLTASGHIEDTVNTNRVILCSARRHHNSTYFPDGRDGSIGETLAATRVDKRTGDAVEDSDNFVEVAGANVRCEELKNDLLAPVSTQRFTQLDGVIKGHNTTKLVLNQSKETYWEIEDPATTTLTIPAHIAVHDRGRIIRRWYFANENNYFKFGIDSADFTTWIAGFDQEAIPQNSTEINNPVSNKVRPGTCGYFETAGAGYVVKEIRLSDEVSTTIQVLFYDNDGNELNPASFAAQYVSFYDYSETLPYPKVHPAKTHGLYIVDLTSGLHVEIPKEYDGGAVWTLDCCAQTNNITFGAKWGDWKAANSYDSYDAYCYVLKYAGWDAVNWINATDINEPRELIQDAMVSKGETLAAISANTFCFVKWCENKAVIKPSGALDYVWSRENGMIASASYVTPRSPLVGNWSANMYAEVYAGDPDGAGGAINYPVQEMKLSYPVIPLPQTFYAMKGVYISQARIRVRFTGSGSSDSNPFNVSACLVHKLHPTENKCINSDPLCLDGGECPLKNLARADITGRCNYGTDGLTHWRYPEPVTDTTWEFGGAAADPLSKGWYTNCESSTAETMAAYYDTTDTFNQQQASETFWYPNKTYYHLNGSGGSGFAAYPQPATQSVVECQYNTDAYDFGTPIFKEWSASFELGATGNIETSTDWQWLDIAPALRQALAEAETYQQHGIAVMPSIVIEEGWRDPIQETYYHGGVATNEYTLTYEPFGYASWADVEVDPNLIITFGTQEQEIYLVDFMNLPAKGAV